MKSLRQQLLLYLMVSLIISSAVTAFITYQNAKDEIDEMFDANLAQVASTLKAGHSSYSTTLISSAEHPNATQVAGEADFIVQIWSAGGTLEYSSHPRIEFPLQTRNEWSTVRFHGGKWRVYLEKDGKTIIQVSQLLKERIATIDEIVMSIMMPQLISIPLFGLIIWLAVGWTMRPLSWISTLIAKRGPNALEPIEEKNIPTEIKPLTSSLNKLLHRLSEALSSQRQFVADAAHELRTPLTALKLQINMIERARNDEERTEAITIYKSGIERSIHLVQQLLTLARMEPEAAVNQPHLPLRLSAIINVCISQYVSLAEDKNIDLGNQHLEDASVEGDFDSLCVMLGNLIDNAIRYTPSGGKIDVNLKSLNSKTVLEVEDSGPGIPFNEHERVFDRFYRVSTEVQGTGLGLSIVSAIAEKHGAKLTLGTSSLGGLKVTMQFGVTDK